MGSIKDKVFTTIAVVAIAGAAYGFGVSGVLEPTRTSAAPVLYNADTVTGIYNAASPAVFEIDTTESIGTGFRGTVRGQGSGFLIDNQGHILTNNHVVDGATTVKVRLDSGIVDAKVLGTDAIDDLAVISVDPAAVKGVTPLQLADSSTVKPGQMAIAIGTPFGLNDSVTVGVISGLGRNVRGSQLTGMLQTDASINPGNSGGPLLDVNGMVVGINTAMEVQAGGNGIGFAVPSSVAQRVLPNLIAGKEVTRPFLGISGVALDQTLANSLNLTVSKGIYIVNVTSGSPADKAGLKGGGAGTAGTPGAGGDVITAVDGKSVASVQDLSVYFSSKNVGDTVSLTIIRNGATSTVQATLAPWPTATAVPRLTPQPIPQTPGRGRFGRGQTD